MSKGEYVPGAVGSFGHKHRSDKGKAQPDTGSGPNMVEIHNTSKPTVAPAGGGRRSTVPAGVVRGDGTETRKGITVKHLTQRLPFPKGGTDSATPPGVVKHSGLSAPKKIK